MRGELQLTVLLFQEGSAWVGQVLEHDMAAHGPTVHAALAAVQLVIQAHVNFDTRHKRQPLARLNRAPDVYWKALERATPLPKPDAVPMMHPARINASITNETVPAPDC